MRFFFIIFLLSLSSLSIAHSGRTDSSGGHNCSQKSKNKGLCYGYHYHNTGYTKVKTPTLKSNTTSQGSYCKGFKAGYKYMSKKLNGIAGIAPVCPIAPINGKYEDGFLKGASEARK